ncbi:MAG: C25 family cysteine peptidase [Bacteroidales bacterium]|nr:C25 family cysteine peptidase [Bacteroidales bacterium]
MKSLFPWQRQHTFKTLLFTVLSVLALTYAISAKAQDFGVWAHDWKGNGIIFRCSTGKVTFSKVAEDYFLLRVEGLGMYTSESGKPQVPLYRTFVTLPNDATPTLETHEVACDTFFLTGKLLPCPPPRMKGNDGPFGLSPEHEAYLADSITPPSLVSLQEMGVMRGKRMALITIAPVQYYPEKNFVTVHRNLEVTIGFGTAKGAYAKPYTEVDGATPVYAIATTDSFRSALEPFIQWKRQEGYDVEVFSSPSWDRDTLRSMLKQRHKTANALHPSPIYVLLAGDIQQIPPCFGTEQLELLGTHLSDFYYGEYTGDMLPDACVGRLPARNVQELSWMLAKTIAYEKTLLADTSYLNRTLLVAGHEQRENTDTLTNGQVNYLKQLLTSNDTICFYNPSSNGQKDEILSAWRRGVGHVNYTAHCLTTGWHHPQIFNEDIDTIGRAGHYFFAVNNCCSSNDLSGNSFGKTLLRTGAVGVIGATGETLWDEDYYWAVGCKTPFALQPAFDSARQGAYDRTIHPHRQPYAEQARTAGEMLWAGNFAVMQYASPFAGYYNETYCLYGDPSLMPYFKVPEPLQIVIEDTLRKGDNHVLFKGTPYARVAITQTGTLLGSCLTDSTGSGFISLRYPISADTVLLTATAQGHRTDIRQIPIATRNGAWLSATEAKPQRLTAGDTTLVTVRWTNVGDSTAFRHTLALQTATADTLTSFHASITPAFFVVDSLPADSTASHAFKVLLRDSQAMEIALFATAMAEGAHAPYSSQPLRLDVQKARIALKDAVLLKDGKPTNQLKPTTNYWLRLIAENPTDCHAAVSRLCVTDFRGGIFLANACHSGVARDAHAIDTILLPLTTNDTLNHLSFHVEAYANNDLTVYDLLFLVNNDIETFSDGDFSHFPWDTSAMLPWIIDTSPEAPFSPSARSATLAEGQRSELAIKLQVNALDTLSFYTKMQSPSAEGSLSFWIDGTRRTHWNATHPKTQRQYVVAAGTHTFLWRYESTGPNGGHAWIDNVRMPFSCYPLSTAGYGSMLTALAIGEQPATEDSIAIFPNPTKGQLWVRNNGSQPHSLAIYDNYGRRISSFTLLPESELPLLLDHLPKGTYLLRHENGHKKIILF